MAEEIVEPCPVCGKLHSAEPSCLFEESDSNGKTIKYVARPDVFCTCGQILRWTVPLIKTTASGFELRVKALKLQPRLSSKLKEAHWDDIKVGILIIVDGKIYGKVTSYDPIGHVWVDGNHFPFTVQHSFKIPPVL